VSATGVNVSTEEDVVLVGVSVAVGVFVGRLVFVGVDVGVAIGVFVGGSGFVGVCVGIAVGVEVDVCVGKPEAVAVGVTVDVGVFVDVGILVGVFVEVIVRVFVGVGVDVSVAEEVGVEVIVAVRVLWVSTTNCGGVVPSREENVTPSVLSATSAKAYVPLPVTREVTLYSTHVLVPKAPLLSATPLTKAG
jgi:hypothetical protein